MKLYNENYFPQENIVKLFKNTNCPFVIKIIDDGMYNDRYFEVTKYYKNGSLNQKKEYSIKFLNEILVPCLNEGLHYLHGNNELNINIIHGDLKPDNIFISDNEDSVIIGDFGISVLMNKNGIAIDDIKGTPEYSSLTTNFYKKTLKKSSYDYASLGLILFKLNYGYSLFANMSEEEIAIKWNNGIVIPDSSNTRLDNLIRGLLKTDENERLGYDSVKKWCEFEYLTLNHKKIFDTDSQKTTSNNYIFGIFNGKVCAVNSFETLAIAMMKNWEHARKVMTRDNLHVFMNELDENICKKYKKLLNEKPIDIVIFIFINEFVQNNFIIYKGINLGNIQNFFSDFEDNYMLKIELLENNALNHLIKENVTFLELNNRLKTILDMDISRERKVNVIKYLFYSQQELILFDKKISTLEELSKLILELDENSRLKVLQNERLVSWLYLNGMGKDALMLL